MSSTVDETRDVLWWACWYAARGMLVMPLHPIVSGRCGCNRPGCDDAGKHPILTGWQAKASTDPSKIENWWGNPSSRDRGIGVVGGGDARLVMIDIDGPEGEAALARLVVHLGALPETLTARTGREDGGRHFYLRCPEGLDLNAIRNRRLLDVDGASETPNHVKAIGGYCVAPPSLHRTGRLYTFDDSGLAIADLPLAWYEHATREKERPAAEQVHHATPIDGPGAARAEADPPLDSAPRWRRIGRVYRSRSGIEYDANRGTPVERASRAIDVTPGVPEGARDTRAFEVACSLVKTFDLSPGEALPILVSWAERCSPPYRDRVRLARKCREADTTPDRVPRGAALVEERPRPSAPPPGEAPPPREEDTPGRESSPPPSGDPSPGEDAFTTLFARLEAAPKHRRTDMALEPEALAIAARLDSNGPQWEKLQQLIRETKDGRLKAWRKAVEALRPAPTGAPSEACTSKDTRPRIVITTDRVAVNDAAIAALAPLGLVYQRAGKLVDVAREVSPNAPIEPDDVDEDKPHGMIRFRGTPTIRLLPAPRLGELLASAARWISVKHTLNGPIERPAHPPDWTVSAVHARPEWPGIKPLAGIVECPILRRDGSILATPGYDASTGVLYEPSRDFILPPDRPTLDDARAMIAVLRDAVKESCFATKVDFSAWLAALLTPLVRHALPEDEKVPMHLVSANTRGAGKGTLVHVISIICQGRAEPSFSQADEAELEKRLAGVAIAGDMMVNIDNVERTLGSQALYTIITEPVYSPRILGVTGQLKMKVRTCFYGTGRNIAIKSDLARRCSIINLLSKEERPETKKYERAIFAYVREHRAELLCAALTLLRAFIVSGTRPDLPGWSGFEEWSRLVRGAIVWAGLPDPVARRGSEDREADTEAAALANLLDGWGDIAHAIAGAPDAGVSAAAVILALESDNEAHRQTLRTSGHAPPLRFGKLRAALYELIPDVRGDSLPNAGKLGAALRTMKARVSGGRSLRLQRGLWSVHTGAPVIDDSDSDGPAQ